MSSKWMVSAVVGLVLAMGCTKAPSASSLESRRAPVNELLAHADAEPQLTSQLGAMPTICIEVGAGLRICEWRLGNRDESWKQLAHALATTDRVAVVCALPSDGGPREPESCRAFPSRSDRTQYEVYTSSSARGARRTKDRQAQRAQNQRHALARLEAARDAVALSHLIGAAPERCAGADDRTIACSWKANGRTYGHGTLVEVAGVPKRKRIRMACRLPEDGSPRGEGSCVVEADE